MRCISPISLKDPRAIRGSQRLIVPCGKCGACRANRRIEWSFRLKQELMSASSAFFITLTYDDENLRFNENGVATLCKEDVQLFIKRLRKAQCGSKKCVIRYYCVGEYGTRTHRPHYHILLFNLDKNLLNSVVYLWSLGHIDIGKVNDSSIHYTTKYHVNFDKEKSKDYGIEPEFALMSRRPGIGYRFLEKSAKWNKDHGNVFVMNNGYAQRMPRYYKDKIFSDYERELLAEEAMSKADWEYWKEFSRLYDLGVKDPAAQMEKAAIHDAERVFDKKNSRDMF